MGTAFPGQERSRHMGELRRGERSWDVYLEMEGAADLGAIRGRIHFLGAADHRTTGWIFLEWREQDLKERFGEFSAVELWHFLEALGA